MLSLKKRDSILEIEENVRNAFGKVKEEFSEHLLAINENTNEVQSNYEYLCEVDARIDKLAERIEEIAMFIKHPASHAAKEYEIAPLTTNEREVFMALYALVAEQGHASYTDLCRRCALTQELVQAYVTNLIAKGVPVLKRYNGQGVKLLLERSFCELQAKENVMQANEVIAGKVITQGV